jgi:hypothetical protein
MDRYPEVDPSILRETSQEVHDEYIKRFDKLPAFSPANNPGAAAGRQPNERLETLPAGRMGGEQAQSRAVELNRQRMQQTMNQFQEMLGLQAFNDEEADFPLDEHVSAPDEPENETEKDSAKIEQILAAVKNSSAAKMDIPQIDLGQDGITFIESDVDEYNLTLFCGAVAMMSNQDKLRDTRYICVGTAR